MEGQLHRRAIDNRDGPMQRAYLHAASHSMADDRQGSWHGHEEPRQHTAVATSAVVRGLDRPLSGDEIKSASVADGSPDADWLADFRAVK